MGSVSITCSWSAEVLSCVFIIAQSRIINKIYWIKKFGYTKCCGTATFLLVFDEATFWVSYFFRASTFWGPLLFSKQLHAFARATFPEDAVF